MGQAEVDQLRSMLSSRKDEGPRVTQLREMIQAKRGPERGVMGKAADLVTGNDRTEFEELPEFDLPPSMALTHPVATAKTAFGLMTSFDPERQRQTLASNFPNLKFEQDNHGNVIVDASAYGGERGYLNKPGASFRDATQAAGQVAAFTPAGRLGTTGNIAMRLGKVGAASAATQAGLDVAGQAVGGTDKVSASNVDKSDVALAAAGGTVFEGLGALLKKALPAFQKSGTVTDSIRQEFKQAAQERGMSPDEVTDELIGSWLRAAEKASKPSRGEFSAEAAQQADEFGIPYTRGQAMPGSEARTRALGVEDTLRHGGGGPSARRRMETFQEGQQAASTRAAETTQRGLGGQPIEGANDAMGRVRSGVQVRADMLDQQIDEAYENIGGASLSVEGLKGLTDRLQRTASTERFVRGKELAPATTEALDRIGKARRLLNSSDRIKPMQIEGLEHQRRRLGNLIDSAKNQQDRRQVTILKREFDGYLNEAVENALFSGDPEALESLTKARSLATSYRQQFTQQNSRMRKSGRKMTDMAGDVIERLANDDPNLTDEQLANYIFGVSKIGAKKGSAALAERLRGVLGAESPEWQSVRQAGFLKLIQPDKDGRISGRMFMRRLDEATRGSGESFMQTLYAPDEIRKMRRLGAAILRAQPEIDNPSKTSYKLSEIARGQLSQLLTTVGFMKGGAVGGIAGRAAAASSEGAFNLGSVYRSIKATRDPMQPLSKLRGSVAVGAPGTVASQQSNRPRQR